jgi:hypothetical protein
MSVVVISTVGIAFTLFGCWAFFTKSGKHFLSGDSE